MENETINESLLLRYLSNDVGEDEMRKVDEWLSKSESNKKVARDLHYIMLASDIIKNSEKISSERAFAEMGLKIMRRRVWKLFTKSFRSAAAILFIPLLMTVAYLLMSDGNRANQYVELRTNSDMSSSVTLPDGSKVWLNSNTYLKYPVVFSSSSREVELDGEAYFSVVKDANRNFRVHALEGEVDIEVLGTEFNVDAYKGHNLITTTLVSGSVKLSYVDDRERRTTLRMEPDEKIVYDRESKRHEKRRVDVMNDISWRDGLIVLNDTPIKDMLWILSKRFNVEFDVNSSRILNSSFTGVFKNQRLDVILEHLKIASSINYKIMPDSLDGEKRRVILY